MAEPSNRQKDIFLQALDIASEEARARFITDACGDDAALRNQVEGMMRAHARADSFLEKPAATLEPTLEIPSPGRHLEEAPGAEVGPYKLLQPIGEGGMGVVWMAEQSEPIRRKVALKIIKPGLASPQVIARFEAERQALAMMDHPNIARVLDAGTTESGRPFFVMELVKGTTITEYCDLNRLTQRERLELFVPVCQAIQHAHQKGIIHRDIKPSNVLVTMYDGTPVAKVIDFGIAKAIREPLTDKTLFTLHGQIIGTFEYMSPEQASLNALDVDTRSDIYALGVLLYELLTGKTPLDKDRLRQAAFGEILRLIREEDPARPSNRLRESGDELAQLALYRKSDSVKLPEQVRGDLDWIAMKALDKDRTRRYETASAFAADVQHFLNDEAIDARPPSTAYRLGKFIKRNRAPVLAASLLLVTLFTGITGTVWGWVEALAQRDRAVQASKDEEQQRQIAVASAAQAKRAEDEARRLAKAEIEARKNAEANETKSEWRLYASQIAAAQRELDAHNFALADQYLKQCRLQFVGWEHDYLRSLLDKAIQTLESHTSPVWSIAYSPDGKLFARGDGNLLKKGAGAFVKATVKVWDLTTSKVIRNWEFEASAVDCLDFSPDSKLLAIATLKPDNAVRLWSISEGNEVRAFLDCEPSDRRRVAFSPDGTLVADGSEGAVWEVATGKQRLKAKGAIVSVAFSPDGKHIAFGPSIWDLASNMEVARMKGPTEFLHSVTYCPNGTLLAGASSDGTLKVWDTSSGELVRNLKGHGGAVLSVAFSPDGARLASGANPPTNGVPVGWSWADGVKLWDVASGREITTLRGHTKGIRSVVFRPDGKALASGSSDKTVKLWELDIPNQGALILQGPADGHGNVAFSPDGTQLSRVSPNRTVSLWDTTSGRILRTLQHGQPQFGSEMFTNARNVGCVTFGPDGLRLLTAFSPMHTGLSSFDKGYGTAKLFDLSSDKEIYSLKEVAGALIDGVAFSSDGKHLATAISVMQPNGKSTPEGAFVQMFDVETGKDTRRLMGHANRVTSVAFNRAGTLLASGSADKTVKLWNTDTGKDIQTLTGHTGTVYGVAFSPDGKLVASASADTTVKLWDTTSGKEDMTLKGHTGLVACVAFSPDGKRLASAAADRTVKLWDTAGGQTVLTLRYADRVVGVAFSPDGRSLAIATDSAVMILNVSTPAYKAVQK